LKILGRGFVPAADLWDSGKVAEYNWSWERRGFFLADYWSGYRTTEIRTWMRDLDGLCDQPSDCGSRFGTG